MENIKIWHEPTEYPSEEARIVVWMDGDQDTAHYYITWLKDKVVITEQGFTYPWERVDRWAYFDQVIAASKALDVAREMYKTVVQDYIDNLYGAAPQYVSRHVTEIMLDYDKKISEIMKGGK